MKHLRWSIYIRVSTNLYIAAICYGAVLIAQVGMQQARPRDVEAG
jgi:hypothetical protein